MSGYKGHRRGLPDGYQHDLNNWVKINASPMRGLQAPAKRLAELAAGIIHIDQLPMGPEPEASPRAAAKELGQLGMAVAEAQMYPATGEVAA